MTTYTTRALPLIDRLDKIASAEANQNLRENINALSQATQRAFDSETRRVDVSQETQDAAISNQGHRLMAVEVLGGLAPGDVSDATSASLVANPESLTRSALGDVVSESLVIPLKPKADISALPLLAQRLDRMDTWGWWSARATGTTAWVQGFSINEDTKEIYVSCYDRGLTIPAQWIEIRRYDGTLKSRSVDVPTTSSTAYSEGAPYFFNGSGQLCFIMRLDVIADAPAGSPKVRIFNYVTGALSAPMAVAGNSKLYSDGQFFYCATADSNLARVTVVYTYTLASIIAASPVLVSTVRLTDTGTPRQDEKPQGLAVKDGYVILSTGKRDGTSYGNGKPGIRIYAPSGQLLSTTSIERQSFRDVLAAQSSPTLADPTGTSYENEGLYPLRDGRVAVLSIIGTTAFMHIHGTASAATMTTVAPAIRQNSVWTPATLASPVSAYDADTAPEVIIDGGGNVTLRGAFKGVTITGANVTLCTIPQEAWPDKRVQFMMPSNGTFVWRGIITTTGFVQLVNTTTTTPTTATWYPIDISYRASIA